MTPPPILSYTTDRHQKTRKIIFVLLWAWYAVTLGGVLVFEMFVISKMSTFARLDESILLMKLFTGFLVLLVPYMRLAQWRVARILQKRGENPSKNYILEHLNRCNMPMIAAFQCFVIVDKQYQWAWMTVGILCALCLAISFPRHSKLWPPQGVQSESGHFD